MSGEKEPAAGAATLAALPGELHFHDRLAVAMTEALRHATPLGLMVADSDRARAEPPDWCNGAGRHHWILEGRALDRLDDAKGDAEVSAGLALLDGAGTTPEDLEALAAKALARARADGTSHGTERARSRRPAPPPIDFDRLQLHYQPQFALAQPASPLEAAEPPTDRISGLEALIRTHDVETGWVTPGQLQDWTRDETLAQELGEWVLREALRQAVAWRSQGLPAVTLAVNLSLAQLRHPRAILRLVEIIEASGLPAGGIELELTEQLPPDHLDVLAARLERLRQTGVGLALDDFGSGFASLTLLHGLPFDRVKLAARLIETCDREAEAEAGLAAFQRHAKARGLAVVAEGVERAGQVESLRRVGCDHLQGYIFGFPMAPGDMARRLAAPPVTPA